MEGMYPKKVNTGQNKREREQNSNKSNRLIDIERWLELELITAHEFTTKDEVYILYISTFYFYFYEQLISLVNTVRVSFPRRIDLFKSIVISMFMNYVPAGKRTSS